MNAKHSTQCAQGGCFGYGMDAVKSKPKGGTDAATIASTREIVPTGLFDG